MDEFMASAATGVMSSLLDKLGELLGEDYKMQRGMRSEIAFLKDELSSMNALLERLADSDVLDPQTKEWRDQVREMSYDIEDCVDDYMRQLRNEPQRHSGITGFFFGYVQKVKDLVTRHEIAEQIQELKARIVEVSHRRKRYKIDGTVNFGGVSVIPVDRRLPALYAELGGLVGISVPRDEVIKLVDDAVQGVKVVSIVGCGGLGKTTVANQVYVNIAKKFDCQAFVSLTQNPDMVIIFQSILSQVKKDECDSTNSCDMELLITELRNFLKDKRAGVQQVLVPGTASKWKNGQSSTWDWEAVRSELLLLGLSEAASRLDHGSARTETPRAGRRHATSTTGGGGRRHEPGAATRASAGRSSDARECGNELRRARELAAGAQPGAATCAGAGGGRAAGGGVRRAERNGRNFCVP